MAAVRTLIPVENGSIDFHDLTKEIDNYIKIRNELSERLDAALQNWV